MKQILTNINKFLYNQHTNHKHKL